jgi:hypothetical protein
MAERVLESVACLGVKSRKQMVVMMEKIRRRVKRLGGDGRSMAGQVSLYNKSGVTR